MTKEPFERQDESFLESFKRLREKKVPSEILKGFSASVEAKIRAKETPEIAPAPPRRIFSPAWAPVLAVLILASLVVWRLPLTVKSSPVMLSSVAVVSSAVSDVAEEIAALRELGVWTDDDEHTINGSPEAAAAELELAEGQETPPA